MELPGLVALIWGGMLLVTMLVVVPVVVRLLHRTYLAARQLERDTARALAGGVGIAGNTADIEALRSTIEVATDILGSSRSIQEHAATIESAMAGRAGG
ncbi:hypothetical protein BH24CHL9_BH24CHL9_01410 [soil metagenome]|jgi:hypothetical protein